MSVSYRNQAIGLQSKKKLMDWFLYVRNLRHERVKTAKIAPQKSSFTEEINIKGLR